MSKKTPPHSPHELFAKFVPAKAVSFCVYLFVEYNFDFKVTKPRKSKLGDYRYEIDSKKHTITINNNLKPYSFLITYIHEVAHLITLKKYGRRVEHHGKEWKHEYSKLITTTLKTGAFPSDLEKELLIFARNPKASTVASTRLVTALKKFEDSDTTILADISINERFSFRQEDYIKLEKRRTRSLCLRLSDNKKFLISEIAEVNQ